MVIVVLHHKHMKRKSRKRNCSV